MVRGIRQFADAVCKRKGLGETRKRKAARQAVYTSDRPDCPARQLGRETRCLNPPSPSDCQAGTPRSFRAPNIPHRHGSPGRPCSRRTPAPVARPRCLHRYAPRIPMLHALRCQCETSPTRLWDRMSVCRVQHTLARETKYPCDSYPQHACGAPSNVRHRRFGLWDDVCVSGTTWHRRVGYDIALRGTQIRLTHRVRHGQGGPPARPLATALFNAYDPQHHPHREPKAWRSASAS